MMQAWWLIYFDLKTQLRERGSITLLLAVLAISGFALWQGSRYMGAVNQANLAATAQQDRAREAANAHATQYFANPNTPENLALRSFRNPADLRGYTFREYVGFAVKPTLSLAPLAIADADVLPSYVRVKFAEADSAYSSAELEHPARLALGRFDLSFVLVYCWPLVLLWLCSSVLTLERETKRLAQLKLQGVRPIVLLCSQIMARVLGATLVLIGLLMVIIVASGVIGLAQWPALLSYAMVVLMYSAFWGGVACVIAAFSQNRTVAAFAGFGAWVLLTVLLPAALNIGIDIAAPVPSRESYIVAMRDATDAAARDQAKSLERFYDLHPEWRPVKSELAVAAPAVAPSIARMARIDALEKLLAPVETSFSRARETRQQLLSEYMWLSPASLAHQLFATLSGNDAARHRLFAVELAQHHRQLRQFFTTRMLQAANGDAQAKPPCASTCLGGYGFTDFNAVPRFSASAALAAPNLTPTSIWILLVWTAALLLLAWAIVRRK